MLLINTSIIIDSLRTNKTKTNILTQLVNQYPQHELAILMITIQELFQGQNTTDLDQSKLLLPLIDEFELLPYSLDIAALAGTLVRNAVGRPPFVDATTAAAALFHTLPVVTMKALLQPLGRRFKTGKINARNYVKFHVKLLSIVES